MNFLAGYLLLWLEEEQAFWALAHIVEDLLLDYFGRNMVGSLVDQKVFAHFLGRALPRLFAHLQRLGFPFSAVTTSWLCCLFLNSLPKCVRLLVSSRNTFPGIGPMR
jgi:hypothetical protein